MSSGPARRGRGILRMVTSNMVVFSLAAMGVTSGALMAFAFRGQQAAVSSSLALAARYAANRAERFIGGQIDFLEAASWLGGESLRTDLSRSGLLDGALGFSPAILQIAAVDRATGAALGVAARRSAASARASGLPFAPEAAAGAEPGRPYISPVYIDNVTDELLITLGVAPPERFEAEGVSLVAQLNLKFMWELIADLDVETGGRAYVVDSAGALVAYGDSSRVLAHEDLSRVPAVAAFVAGGGEGAPAALGAFRGIEGDRVVGTYVALEAPPWAVVVELPWADAYREAVQAIALGLAAVAAMTVAIFIIGLFLSKRLSSPIANLARAVSGMAEEGRLIAVEASGPDEVVELADAFNAMADRLKRNEERFSRLIWNSSDIIAVAGADGVLSYVSASLERIFGYPPSKAVGRRLTEFLREDEADKAAQVFAALSRSSGAAARAVFRFRASDGREADVEVIGVNLLQDPDIGGLVLNLRDVSERAEAERERSRLQDRLQHAMKMEAVGRLAGGIAHDFNNLLTGIYGSVQMLRMEAGDPAKTEHYLAEIRKAAESAAALTRQLLAYSRKQPIETRLVDLNALILDLGGMLERLLGEDVDVAYSLGRGLGPVRIDPSQFQQALVNLAANARDAMPEGGSMTISTEAGFLDPKDCASHEGLRPGRILKLTVADTGRGMDAEELGHLFEPFYTTKPLGKGTGLGLAMVYGAVRQSGGSIDARSGPGEGTAFTILLPMEAGDAEALGAPPADGEPERGTETILLVEDNPSVMEVTARMLEKLGYAVIQAEGGDEALRALGDGAGFDALVTDVSMPSMNGVELAERVKKLRPGIGVLFLSGYAEEALKRKDAMSALGRFIMKPYKIETLAARLREALRGSATSA
jgi:PAS domain S-box-containing protein